VTKGRGIDVIGDINLYKYKRWTLVQNGSLPQASGIILLKKVSYSSRVLGYSLRYSPSTRVANYLDSTALVHTRE